MPVVLIKLSLTLLGCKTTRRGVVSQFVAFRSAKASPFAERKATIRQSDTLPARGQGVIHCLKYAGSGKRAINIALLTLVK